mmetsp:Transcript_32922/g.97155  ORF Transcript_32922/g.97155 Transcript_32922/m.97155 type:complete len:443 (-) Transcript_32922:79-1407(-)
MKSSSSTVPRQEQAKTSPSTGSSTICGSGPTPASSSSHNVPAVNVPAQDQRQSSSSPSCSSAAAAASSSSAASSSAALATSQQQQTQAPQTEPNETQTQIQSLLFTLSKQFVTATRHHLALGALHYQRCSYRSSTEHYQRAINFLMRREDVLAKYRPCNTTTTARRSGSKCADGTTPCGPGGSSADAVTKELGVDIEKMEFYTYVLRLNNAVDIAFLQRRQQEHQEQRQQRLTHARTVPPIAKCSTRKTTKRPLPPRRLAFYLDQHDSSFALDSHMEAHQVLPSSSSCTIVGTPTPCSTSAHHPHALHLLKAYVMYNLALCHVALGSYAESLNLLQMVIDDDQSNINTNTSLGGLPLELDEIIRTYRQFVRGVLQVQQTSANATTTTSTTTTTGVSLSPTTATAEEGPESMDIDTAEEDDSEMTSSEATAGEGGDTFPASAA